MTSLFAIVFKEKSVAEEALAELTRLQAGAVLQVHDAVYVARTQDGGVKLDQSLNTTALGAVSGAFWGSLIGLIFLAPLLGAAAGAAAGGISGYFTDYGVNDDFARRTGERLAVGDVALFVLASNATPERVAEALKPFGGELFYSSFPPDVEERFRQAIRSQGLGGGASSATPAPASSLPAAGAQPVGAAQI